MATWIAHMRIAEYFMKEHSPLNTPAFLVGNIGPDCGVPNEDWSAFTPDKAVSHWMTDGKNIDCEDFKRKYLQNGKDSDPFYIGYYFHLITDVEWGKLYALKKEEPLYYEGLNKDNRFIWKIKEDWYGQDHLYLREHPECVFFTVFAKIRAFDNPYFDFYPPEAFARKISYITNFYLTAKEDPSREFPYLSKAEMDEFVTEAIAVLRGEYASL